jgi:hypothetical protein
MRIIKKAINKLRATKLLRKYLISKTKKYKKGEQRGGELVTITVIGTDGINTSDQLKNFNINRMFSFFDVNEDMHDYLKYAIHDTVGLYSIMNWKSPTTYNNVTQSNKGNNTEKQKETNKEKEDFVIGKIVSPRGIKIDPTKISQYRYEGSFLKKIKIGSTDIIFKCQIFHNLKDSNKLVLFKWGFRYDLTHPECATVLDELYDFITRTINKNYSSENILLFGFSMGGNIAQHIALRFINDKDNISSNMKDNIYIVSFGIGGTMTSETIDIFNNSFNGRFISIAVATDFESKKYKSSIAINSDSMHHQINTYILRDNEKMLSIKSLIINMDTFFGIDFKPYYKKGRFFSSTGIDKVYFDATNISALHNFRIYRKYIDMLVNDEDTSII